MIKQSDPRKGQIWNCYQPRRLESLNEQTKTLSRILQCKAILGIVLILQTSDTTKMRKQIDFLRPKYLQFLLQLICRRLWYQRTNHSKDDTLCHPQSFQSSNPSNLGFSQRLVFATIPSLRLHCFII